MAVQAGRLESDRTSDMPGAGGMTLGYCLLEHNLQDQWLAFAGQDL